MALFSSSRFLRRIGAMSVMTSSTVAAYFLSGASATGLPRSVSMLAAARSQSRSTAGLPGGAEQTTVATPALVGAT
jgi:hypothetical protein